MLSENQQQVVEFLPSQPPLLDLSVCAKTFSCQGFFLTIYKQKGTAQLDVQTRLSSHTSTYALLLFLLPRLHPAFWCITATACSGGLINKPKRRRASLTHLPCIPHTSLLSVNHHIAHSDWLFDWKDLMLANTVDESDQINLFSPLVSSTHFSATNTATISTAKSCLVLIVFRFSVVTTTNNWKHSPEQLYIFIIFFNL